MPRRKLLQAEKPAKRQLWDKADMERAIKAVRKKECGCKTATNRYKVPRTTLQRYLKNECADVKTLGRPTVLGCALEAELVSYAKAMESRLFGLTRRDLVSVAFQLVERNKVKHPFSNGVAGRGWFSKSDT
jgi:hypothetical protein